MNQTDWYTVPQIENRIDNAIRELAHAQKCGKAESVLYYETFINRLRLELNCVMRRETEFKGS